ncbi:MAG: tRNA (N6-threonylcarbamoyladenosine(37)-N6)-methyltransferase TrmO [Polyangiaceae bacterium]|nr:tRNA (N6-threonylcarbamoyladenosine(37)-N6)-methyltransferase TrmO [Polyangiaceae bacterium]MCL4750837.1 tRNA (N6-threonylcarbamoyladenosine(37)-N6)-methyltransferase TrmO [Myxococcales bacterium]
MSELRLTPIGVVRSPFGEPAEAPRQPAAARGVEARIELDPGRGFEFALEDVESWRYLWVLFWFDRAEGWRPKVRPPRSRERRGVFATRSPHRPNPIGLSVVELVRVEGLTLHVRDVDILDGTPVLDLKPYVAYTDVPPDPGTGWLEAEARQDPGPRWEVRLSARAAEQAGFLRDRFGIELVEPVTQALSLGPAPHPYRRIKRDGDELVIAHKDWRARFRVEGTSVTVLGFASGYRPRELHAPAGSSLEPHRCFVQAFGYPGDRT